MALIPVGEELPDLQRDFVSLCHEVSVVNSVPHRWVSLDRLWWEVGQRERFSELTVEYLRFLLGAYSPEQVIVVSPDTVSSSFGATPAVFLAAGKLGYRVAVWQELGDFAALSPIMIGSRCTRLKCLVLQDVIRYGTTILKMRRSLAERRWDVISYACFVLNCPNVSRLEATQREYSERAGRELQIQYLATAYGLT